MVYTYRGLFKNLTLGQYLIPGELQEREEGPYRNHKVHGYNLGKSQDREQPYCSGNNLATSCNNFVTTL